MLCFALSGCCYEHLKILECKHSDIFSYSYQQSSLSPQNKAFEKKPHSSEKMDSTSLTNSLPMVGKNISLLYFREHIIGGFAHEGDG